MVSTALSSRPRTLYIDSAAKEGSDAATVLDSLLIFVAFQRKAPLFPAFQRGKERKMKKLINNVQILL
ncbi:MAG TPA: hypothetical protein VJ417_07700, partial [Candidatus Glassbacteria bacterium]|nr:hypothetical protein [Candidatus Glassbacteria bacterium]